MAAEITSATVSGRLNGGLAGAGGSDWFTVAPGRLILPDVRLAVGKGIMSADLSRIDYEVFELQ